MYQAHYGTSFKERINGYEEVLKKKGISDESNLKNEDIKCKKIEGLR